MLCRYHRLRNDDSGIDLPWLGLHVEGFAGDRRNRRRRDEERPTIAAPRLQYERGPFAVNKLPLLQRKIGLSDLRRRRLESVRLGVGVRQAQQLLVRHAAGLGFEVGLKFTWWSEQNNRPFELAFVLFKIRG